MNSLNVETPLGRMGTDIDGEAIGVVRLDPEKSYPAVPTLLKQVIDGDSESAWSEIKTRIDYTYESLGQAMDALESESPFSQAVREQVAQGKKLLFKPNIVSGTNIDATTHDPVAVAVNTPWAFIAALMRWFHDRLEISYHQMSLGEGATMTAITAGMFSRMQDGKEVTTQSVMEGKNGDFYGGWGFYFVRRYLADSHDPSHTDDPMLGLAESEAGNALPPGQALNKLMVYDINRVTEVGLDGREVPVENGINYQSIVLHKVLVGGDPNDPEDMKNYPGCVLINVPKLKVHVLDIVTNAVKNLGIGLYPMELNVSDDPGKIKWLYATPDKPMPGLKDKLPHAVWRQDRDEATGQPHLDEDGETIWIKTGGLQGTIADVMVAMMGQNVLMLHISEAIETSNGLQAGPAAVEVPEGFIFASLDPVALDLLCTRYLFSNTPMAEAVKIQKAQNLKSSFLQKVPIPYLDGQTILTKYGYDSPLWRYPAMSYYQERGLGQPDYFVSGTDLREGGDLVSVNGHLGSVRNDIFSELKTDTFYTAVAKPLWDLQPTTFAYVKANDQLEGTTRFQELLAAFDDNRDGVIDYNEFGKFSGVDTTSQLMRLMALDVEPGVALKCRNLAMVQGYRNLKAEWNNEGASASGLRIINMAVTAALNMSKVPADMPDPFTDGLTWGNGKWPSLRFVEQALVSRGLFGMGFPQQVTWMSPYGFAFCYADIKWGSGKFTGGAVPAFDDGSNYVGDYHQSVNNGGKPLPFTFYVPEGFGKQGENPIPNVQVTSDPSLLFTTQFDNGSETWKELTQADFPD